MTKAGSFYQEFVCGPVAVCPVCIECGFSEYAVASDCTERDWRCPVCGGPARDDCALFYD